VNSNNFNPLVSIIVNCYNGDKYLLKALNSIVNQTYKNWEVIFWDVSISKKSKEIFDSFKEERFKYFFSNKKKLYHSRNEAIKQSKGEIIAFLDCDDWWVENKLEKQVPVFKDDSISLVYSNYFSYFEKSKKILAINKKKIYSGYIQNKLLKSYHIGILTTLIRKKIFDKLSGYNNDFHICGDFEFNIRLSHNNKIIGFKEPLAYYRVHQENISKNLSKEIEELENCLNIFKKQKIKDEDLNQFNNFIIYKKFYKSIYERKIKKAFKIFLKMRYNLLKIKALILFFLPKSMLNR